VAGRVVRRVRTTRGDFRPAELVLAGGAWSAQLASRLGLDLPLEPVKGHAITVPGRQALRRPVTLGEDVLAITPTGDGLRIGGGRDQAGFDTAVSQAQVDGMLRAVRRYLPHLAFDTPTQLWTGLRPTTPDGVPFIGRIERYGNVSITCGHGHIGMGLAPAGGRLLAQLMSDEPPDVDPAPFRVSRPIGVTP
jgi:D-amino-acid dehydrogenase